MARGVGFKCGEGLFFLLLWPCFLVRAELARNERECISGNNYCYRADVCAFVFSFNTNGDGSCPELEEAVNSVNDMDADIELLGIRIKDTNREVETLRHQQDSNQGLIHQHNEIVNDLRARVNENYESLRLSLDSVKEQVQSLINQSDARSALQNQSDHSMAQNTVQSSIHSNDKRDEIVNDLRVRVDENYESLRQSLDSVKEQVQSLINQSDARSALQNQSDHSMAQNTVQSSIHSNDKPDNLEAKIQLLERKLRKKGRHFINLKSFLEKLFPLLLFQGCRDSCKYKRDGICEDGGPGSRYSLCEYGTDCSDCGYRFDPSDFQYEDETSTEN
ncbi:apolipoprotein A-IV-like isoform X2 [Ptychodera flava]|uniref:apolipoprotein A-IV-like isoform X2 n=1 Tax=Ptychodera flava TaxID=63121 RepID=UPI00396A8BD9